VKGRYNLGDLGVDGRIILKCILEKESVKLWNVFSWLKICPS